VKRSAQRKKIYDQYRSDLVRHYELIHLLLSDGCSWEQGIVRMLLAMAGMTPAEYSDAVHDYIPSVDV
jgi:hypothetical protein